MPGFLSLFFRKKSNPKSCPKAITAVFGVALIGREGYCGFDGISLTLNLPFLNHTSQILHHKKQERPIGRSCPLKPPYPGATGDERIQQLKPGCMKKGDYASDGTRRDVLRNTPSAQSRSSGYGWLFRNGSPSYTDPLLPNGCQCSFVL